MLPRTHSEFTCRSECSERCRLSFPDLMTQFPLEAGSVQMAVGLLPGVCVQVVASEGTNKHSTCTGRFVSMKLDHLMWV